MNNDYLRVNSKDDEPDIVSGEFSAKAKQQKQTSSREEKITLWSLLNAKHDRRKQFVGGIFDNNRVYAFNVSRVGSFVVDNILVFGGFRNFVRYAYMPRRFLLRTQRNAKRQRRRNLRRRRDRRVVLLHKHTL